MHVARRLLGGERRARKHAVMQPKGSGAKYITYQEAPTVEQLARHLAGEITLAPYLIDQDGKAHAWAFDTDEGGAEGVRARLEALTAAGYPCIGTAAPGSGGHDGGHGWGYWPEGVEPADGKAEITRILEAAGLPTGEVWPKGSAIRGPLGVHTHTGKRGTLIRPGMPDVDADTPEGLAVALEALVALQPSPLPPPARVEQPPARPAPLEPASAPTTGRESAGAVIARFKREHTAEQLLERAGATRTSDGWACNCGVAHEHTTQIYITSYGHIGFYSPRCRWGDGGATDRNGNRWHNVWDFYAQVWHGGDTKAALKEYNPIRAQERDKDAERKRNARHAEAAAILQDVRDRAAQDEILARRPSEAAVLSALLEMAGDRHWCRPSKARLVEMTGWSLGAVKRALIELEARGYFVSEGDGGGPEHTALRTFLCGSPPPDDSGRSYVDQGDPRIKEERVSAAPTPPDPPAPEPPAAREPAPPAEAVAFEGGASFDPDIPYTPTRAPADNWHALYAHWATIAPAPAEPLPDPVGQLPLNAERAAAELQPARADVKAAWSYYWALKKAGAAPDVLRAAAKQARFAEQHAASATERQREQLAAAAGVKGKRRATSGRRSPAPAAEQPALALLPPPGGHALDSQAAAAFFADSTDHHFTPLSEPPPDVHQVGADERASMVERLRALKQGQEARRAA